MIESFNTFYSLIILIRNSGIVVNLNRIGSNPLEHLFGKVRTRCHDVHTFQRFMSAFTSEILDSGVAQILDFIFAPKRKTSIGVIVNDNFNWEQYDTPSHIIAKSLFSRFDFSIASIFDSFEISPQSSRE